ncbi:SET and MYND domain-containing protein DDB_G0284059 [Impatiens glandulifera]|uniref:SET and MYND domain-containing protein DDB_G0284059 n=1 Tax=Impatiens glandulifera TaxID=253017 RepID=UPI001FB161F3|nr:SET and MYND domain-containing protein DDB_G0284059 [Impatiens glandulifera]
MEELKSMVPVTLQRQIARSTTDDLVSTCSSLLDFFLQLPQFHQIVKDLTDPERALCGKNKEASLESKRKANDFFTRGEYSKAIKLYSKALRVAPIDADDTGKNIVATLYVNRSASFHKMGLLKESLRDCNRALAVSPNYSKAWYRRSKANASLKNYRDALCDLHIAIKQEHSLPGKKQIENEIKYISDMPTESIEVQHELSRSDYLHTANENIADESYKQVLQCVHTPAKGRGMVSVTDVPQASLVHVEEPFASIIQKHCRETYCHFCFNELLEDTVPCSSCSIPLYCSQQCQVKSGGWRVGNLEEREIPETLSNDLQTYMLNITSENINALDVNHFSEHIHECNGANWAAILPSEVVLAGRILSKLIKQKRQSSNSPYLDLCHNYEHLHAERKLQLHIYSIVLLFCLQHFYRSQLSKDGRTISKIVVLLSQIKVNSMAIIRMKFPDSCDPIDSSQRIPRDKDDSTVDLEQVRVGQAIYLDGSLFNHSCKPNIHVYFVSRSVYIRSTDFIAAGCPMELSYGPQVGQWDCKSRKEILWNTYSFECQCKGCMEINLPDLVLNGFRCVKPNCLGVVPDTCTVISEKQKFNTFQSTTTQNLNIEDIRKVASLFFDESGRSSQMELGDCLNCGSQRDMEESRAIVKRAEVYLRRLQNMIASNGNSQTDKLSNGLVGLDLLKSTLHMYNKKLAEAEDNLGQASCFVGELQPALEFCKASLQILEKLYGPDHIAIGNELIKLASLQVSIGKGLAAATSIKRARQIFLRYYGSQTDMIFKHLHGLETEAHKEETCNLSE